MKEYKACRQITSPFMGSFAAADLKMQNEQSRGANQFVHVDSAAMN